MRAIAICIAAVAVSSLIFAKSAEGQPVTEEAAAPILAALFPAPVNLTTSSFTVAEPLEPPVAEYSAIPYEQQGALINDSSLPGAGPSIVITPSGTTELTNETASVMEQSAPNAEAPNQPGTLNEAFGTPTSPELDPSLPGNLVNAIPEIPGDDTPDIPLAPAPGPSRLIAPSTEPSTAPSNASSIDCLATYEQTESWSAGPSLVQTSVNFYIENAGNISIEVPYTVSVTAPGVTSTENSWNWEVSKVGDGDLEGQLSQDWETLRPDGDNEVNFGAVIVLNATVATDLKATSIGINGILCSVA